MLPPPCQGGIASEQHVRLAVDDADAGRREDLVAREHVEVAVERLHVDRHVRDGLRAVDQHARAVAVRDLDHLARRRDRAERVRDLRERRRAASAAEQLLVLVEQDLAAVVDRRDAQPRALLGARAAATARCSRGARASVMTISSPAPTLRRPQLCATRLMPSVAPRTKTISLRRRRVEEAPHLSRARPRRRRSRAPRACARARWMFEFSCS